MMEEVEDPTSIHVICSNVPISMDTWRHYLMENWDLLIKKGTRLLVLSGIHGSRSGKLGPFDTSMHEEAEAHLRLLKSKMEYDIMKRHIKIFHKSAELFVDKDTCQPEKGVMTKIVREYKPTLLLLAFCYSGISALLEEICADKHVTEVERKLKETFVTEDIATWSSHRSDSSRGSEVDLKSLCDQMEMRLSLKPSSAKHLRTEAVKVKKESSDEDTKAEVYFKQLEEHLLRTWEKVADEAARIHYDYQRSMLRQPFICMEDEKELKVVPNSTFRHLSMTWDGRKQSLRSSKKRIVWEMILNTGTNEGDSVVWPISQADIMIMKILNQETIVNDFCGYRKCNALFDSGEIRPGYILVIFRSYSHIYRMKHCPKSSLAKFTSQPPLSKFLKRRRDFSERLFPYVHTAIYVGSLDAKHFVIENSGRRCEGEGSWLRLSDIKRFFYDDKGDPSIFRLLRPNKRHDSMMRAMAAYYEEFEFKHHPFGFNPEAFTSACAGLSDLESHDGKLLLDLYGNLFVDLDDRKIDRALRHRERYTRHLEKLFNENEDRIENRRYQLRWNKHGKATVKVIK